MADMVADRCLETPPWVGHIPEAFLEAAEERVERVELDPVEQLFLTGHIVINAGEAHLGLGGDPPHGCPVKSDFGKDPRGRLQQMKPSGIKARGPFWCSVDSQHLVRSNVRSSLSLGNYTRLRVGMARITEPGGVPPTGLLLLWGEKSQGMPRRGGWIGWGQEVPEEEDESAGGFMSDVGGLLLRTNFYPCRP
jgi:hypothetical protein